MSLSEQTLSALQQLMAQDQALRASVQTTSDAHQAAALIAEAAEKNNISVSTAELTSHFEQLSAAINNQALTDEQLTTVAGGMNDGEMMLMVSFLSLGFLCAMKSMADVAGLKGAVGMHKKFC